MYRLQSKKGRRCKSKEGSIALHHRTKKQWLGASIWILHSPSFGPWGDVMSGATHNSFAKTSIINRRLADDMIAARIGAQVWVVVHAACLTSYQSVMISAHLRASRYASNITVENVSNFERPLTYWMHITAATCTVKMASYAPEVACQHHERHVASSTIAVSSEGEVGTVVKV